MNLVWLFTVRVDKGDTQTWVAIPCAYKGRKEMNICPYSYYQDAANKEIVHSVSHFPFPFGNHGFLCCVEHTVIWAIKKVSRAVYRKTF